ncbi:MAG: hypothetical protein U0795_08795 [Pirellulales bacterium]
MGSQLKSLVLLAGAWVCLHSTAALAQAPAGGRPRALDGSRGWNNLPSRLVPSQQATPPGYPAYATQPAAPVQDARGTALAPAVQAGGAQAGGAPNGVVPNGGAQLTGHFDSAGKLGGSTQGAPGAADRLQRARTATVSESTTNKSSRRTSSRRGSATANPPAATAPAASAQSATAQATAAATPGAPAVAGQEPLPAPPAPPTAAATAAPTTPPTTGAADVATSPSTGEPAKVAERQVWTLAPDEPQQRASGEAGATSVATEPAPSAVSAPPATDAATPVTPEQNPFPAPVVDAPSATGTPAAAPGAGAPSNDPSPSDWQTRPVDPSFRDVEPGSEAGNAAVNPSPSEQPAVGPVAVDAPTAQVTSDSDESELLSNESPVLSVRTLGPRTVVVGRAAEYRVMLQNASAAEAENVEVKVAVPSWAEIQQAQGGNGSAVVEPDDQGNSIVRWSIRHLGGRSQEQLTMQIIPRSSRPFDLGVNWTFTPASALTRINVQEPKLEITVVGPADVLYGETKVYTLLVSNPGTGDTENVMLKLMPLEAGEQPPGQRELGVIKAGERKSIDIELTARQAGRLQVRASVEAAGGLQAEATQDVLVRRAHLDVTVEGPKQKFAGSEATYKVRVANDGDAGASEVSTVVTLPAGAQFVAATEGGNYRAESRQVTWPLGTLRPGTVRDLEFTCRLTSSGDNRFDVRTAASGDLSDLETMVTEVEALADLKLTVNDPQGAVPVGTNTDYEIHVVNRGTKAAENVAVVGYFSEGIEPVSISGWRGTVGEGQVVLEQIPRIAPGQEMVIRVTAVASKTGNHVFRAELECPAPETRLAQEEWTRFYGNDESIRTARREADPAKTPAATPSPDAHRSGAELRR